MELPRQLRANRERLHLSQDDMARAIFVSRQTISNWENGKTYPDVQSLLLLSNLFGVSIDELVRGDVQSMQDGISKDAATLKKLSYAMVGLLATSFILCGMAVILRDVGEATSYGMSMAALIALGVAVILLLCAFGVAVWSEVLKKQNDLVTYSEIVAFVQGRTPEEAQKPDAFGRRHPILSAILKVLLGAIAGILLIVGFNIIAKTIRDIIFMNVS